MESSSTLYKLIILYMLNKASFPMTNAQISAYILDSGYTSYFHLQEAINEMIDSFLLKTDVVRNTTYYHMTEEGQNTLDFFVKEISPEIREEIDLYMKEHSYELRSEVSTIADYYKTSGQEYEAHCQVRERTGNLIELKLSVPSEETAKAICNHWLDKSQEIYQYLMKTLG
ncbi:MAG: DUF4364 family protein [Lachnospiraceae bacterium]|nr:DUF4364 family protein [Lachnospiraceae bacterium]